MGSRCPDLPRFPQRPPSPCNIPARQVFVPGLYRVLVSISWLVRLVLCLPATSLLRRQGTPVADIEGQAARFQPDDVVRQGDAVQ